MANIQWITAEGDLGTYPENLEFNLQLEVQDPLAPNVQVGFDPRDSITGNGLSGQVSGNIELDKTVWKFNTLNFPGSVRTGAFPNGNNPAPITASLAEFQYPYRGGLSTVPAVLEATPTLGPIAFSAVGLPFYGPSNGTQVVGAQTSVWTVNAVEVNTEAWSRIPQWQSGATHPNGHSRIVGWAADGYPIYGPYGYDSPLLVSAVVRMQSGYTASIKANRPRPINVRIIPGVYTSPIVNVEDTTGLYAGQILRGPWPEGLDFYCAGGAQNPAVGAHHAT